MYVDSKDLNIIPHLLAHFTVAKIQTVSRTQG